MKQSLLRDGRLDENALVAELRRFLDLAVREMHLELEYDMQRRGGVAEASSPGVAVLVNFRGRDHELLLERQGELLLALEYLAARCLGLVAHGGDQIHFDCNDFRAMHIAELKLAARVAAEKVRDTGQPFHFNTMAARERRIMHLELADFPGVHSASEGAGPQRHLVILPGEVEK
jgi:spoIIIJ-associated protein